VGRIDGTETWRAPFAATGAVNQDFSADLAPGRHTIEIANEGAERLHLASIRLQGIRPASFAGGWNYRPESFGLRRGDRAAVYVAAPAAVAPAGAIRFQPPLVSGETVTLTDWPAGRFVAHWIDPQTGRDVASRESVTATGGRLVLPLPDFAVDLAARIERV